MGRFFETNWNLIFLSASHWQLFLSNCSRNSAQELTNHFLRSTNTLLSSAGFTLDCCHGSTNLPMSIRQGQSVWQRYCLEGWFTLRSLNSQEERVHARACVHAPEMPTVRVFCLPNLSRERSIWKFNTMSLSTSESTNKRGLAEDLAFKVVWILRLNEVSV